MDTFQKGRDYILRSSTQIMAECVKAAEINQMRIEEVKSVAGVNEEINTWNGWNNWGMK